MSLYDRSEHYYLFLTNYSVVGHFISNYVDNVFEMCVSHSIINRKQEAQLMLTNLRDAFGGQSRSPNIVPFHMLGIVSYCAIVTLSSASTIN